MTNPENKITLRVSKKINSLDKKIEDTKQWLASLHAERDEVYAGQRVVCPWCNKMPKIKECTYIQTYWYTPPHGCTGGDHWNLGEGRFRCSLCSEETRLYNKPEIEKLKKHFGKIEEEES